MNGSPQDYNTGSGAFYDQGLKKWYWLNAKSNLHRVCGNPAVIYDNGYKEWWVDGKQFTSGDNDDYYEACDDFFREQHISIPGRKTKRATPN